MRRKTNIELLRDRMYEKGFTLEWLAAHTPCSYATAIKAWNGRTPQRAICKGMSQVLGVKVNELFPLVRPYRSETQSAN